MAAPADSQPPSDTERDRLIALLREHFAAGGISLDELNRRVEQVLAAADLGQAETALDGLLPLRPDNGIPAVTGPRRWLRRRGHAQSARAQPGWLPTEERFRDPSSGVVMRVWVDPADQTRHYVPD